MNGQTAFKPKNNGSPWEERFGWYHYDGTAVYNFTQKDLDDAATLYDDNGITAVILFGTHFRFSFWAYWNDIEDFIARFTAAFHAKGIKVIEHHSSHLTYNPLEESFWEKNATGSLSTFPNFRETSQSNPVLGGAHMDDFAQIDGSTGKPCLSSYIHTEGKNVDWIFRHYRGNAHCFNHPAFEASYREHLRRIIEKSQLDGMMNDDVQWFGGGNACACEYCRAKFKAETGYVLPSPEGWDDFFEHYELPEYIAWKKFKKKQSGDFHRRMDEFYRSLGFKPLRPAYCAEVLPFDTTCYGFEAAAELWDFIFQECCGIIKHSYICFAAEAVHRYAMAKRHGVPSMALLYPRTADSVYASWALCRSWGQLYTGTGGDPRSIFDKPYREFEREHADLYRAPIKKADASFYFSETTRDYTDKDAPQKYMKPYMSYLESAYVSGISCDMVFRSDTAEALAESRRIIVPYIVMISDSEAATLRKYAENGGTLIVLGKFAEKTDDGACRDISERLALLGMKSLVEEREYIGCEAIGNETFRARSNEIFSYIAPDAEILATGTNGEVLAVREKVGNGNVIYHPADISFHPIQPAVWPTGKRTPVDRSFVSEMKQGNGKLISLLLGGQTTYCDIEDVLASLFYTAEGYALHLVNTSGMLPEIDTDASSTDPVPSFTENSEKLGGFRVTLRDTDIPRSAVMYSPEFEGGIAVPFDVSGDTVTLNIPGGKFSGYALIHIC